MTRILYVVATSNEFNLAQTLARDNIDDIIRVSVGPMAAVDLYRHLSNKSSLEDLVVINLGTCASLHKDTIEIGAVCIPFKIVTPLGIDISDEVCSEEEASVPYRVIGIDPLPYRTVRQVTMGSGSLFLSNDELRESLINEGIETYDMETSFLHSCAVNYFRLPFLAIRVVTDEGTDFAKNHYYEREERILSDALPIIKAMIVNEFGSKVFYGIEKVDLEDTAFKCRKVDPYNSSGDKVEDKSKKCVSVSNKRY